MQYKAVTALLAGEKWTFEIKLDGCRLHCREARKRGHLFSRNEKVT